MSESASQSTSKDLQQIRSALTLLQAQIEADAQSRHAPLSSELRHGLRQLHARLESLGRIAADQETEVRNLRALAEIGRVVNSSLDLTTVLNEVMDTIIQLTGADRAFLMLSNEGGEMKVVVARNWERANLGPEEVEVSRSVVLQVIRSGETVLTTNAQTDSRFDAQASILAYNLRSILCVPLMVKDDLTGVIYADNKLHDAQFNQLDLSLLTAFAHQAAVALENARLFDALASAYDSTLMALIAALDARDHETQGHSQRVVLYTLALAERLDLPEHEMETLRRGALMHDIGKIGIPDAVLLKPGPLSEDEWSQMRQHPAYGLKMLQGITFLYGAVDIIHSHQERYDGSGYPRGLAAENIPLGARIFAVADAFDAITSNRPYRKAQSYAFAREEIRRGRGTQFDPLVVDAFMDIQPSEWLAMRQKSLEQDQRLARAAD